MPAPWGEAPRIADALAAWFRESGRDMPWRRTRDPYAIWLSEVMLQQTRVETVWDYHGRFLERWPTATALAQAPIGEVMKAWEGLGYYARCRNLHKAAQIVAHTHGGRFPDTMEDVHALPGIGRSTAGAILTFGHGQRWPLLDGNVRRVLCRLRDEARDPTRAAVERDLWSHSEALLGAADDAWVHNQAVMELGAVVCTPRSPDCARCPVRGFCRAAAAGTQLDRPRKGARKGPLPHQHIGVGVIRRDDGRVLIQLRPPEGLLGGLWEFPGGKQEPGETIPDTIRREIAEELGIEVEVGAAIREVKHAYSHFRITLHAHHCRWVSGEPRPLGAAELRWVPLRDLPTFAFPKANKVVLNTLLEGDTP